MEQLSSGEGKKKKKKAEAEASITGGGREKKKKKKKQALVEEDSLMPERTLCRSCRSLNVGEEGKGEKRKRLFSTQGKRGDHHR